MNEFVRKLLEKLLHSENTAFEKAHTTLDKKSKVLHNTNLEEFDKDPQSDMKRILAEMRELAELKAKEMDKNRAHEESMERLKHKNKLIQTTHHFQEKY